MGALFLPLAWAAGVARCDPSMCGQSQLSTCPAPRTTPPQSPPLVLKPRTLFWYNAAPHSAELLQVQIDGTETPLAILPPNVRRHFHLVHGDVLRARAVRPGHAADRQLLVEHEVSEVPIKDCDCPEPEFVDCSKPPFKGNRHDRIINPVTFQNLANQPIDIFYWNGTCEELISWDEVGGVQPMSSKSFLSTQGHIFRARSAASRRMITQYTLSDIIIRSCEDDSTRRDWPDTTSLAVATAELKTENSNLRSALLDELATLLVALRGAVGNSSSALNPSNRPASALRNGLAVVALSPFGKGEFSL